MSAIGRSPARALAQNKAENSTEAERVERGVKGIRDLCLLVADNGEC